MAGGRGTGLHEATGALPPVVVSRSVLSATVAADRRVTTEIGRTLTLRGDCLSGVSALPPVEFEIVGVAEFPFDGESSRTVAVRPQHLAEV